jgi:hypothetical protein
MSRFRIVALRGLVLVFATALAAAQATPPETKAEQLSAAARRGDAATVKKLLDQGVDPNTKFRYGVTALTYACDHGHLEVVKVLLAHGADMNVKDTFYGSTPLGLAISPAQTKKPEHTEIAKLLIAKGAAGKEDALSSAVSDGDAALTKFILDSGGLPAPILTDALENAKASNKNDIVLLLVTAGARPYDDFKIDAAQLARYAGSYQDARASSIVCTVNGSRLAAAAFGQKFVLSAMDATRFRVIGAPGITITFQSADGKVTGLILTEGSNTTPFTRVEGKQP